MAVGRPPAPQPHPVVPPVVPPVPPVQPPTQPIVLPVQLIQPDPMPQLHWSLFKPEFTGKPDEDQKHIFCGPMTRWSPMLSQKVSKVQQFCLTLVGEARLWYESLRPIALYWNQVQYQFRNNTLNRRYWEQLLHAWRSFHFDKNSETLDTYVTCIRQVATLLSYGKP